VTEILWKRNRTSLSPPEIWKILRPIGLSLWESPMSKILHKQTWNSAVQATRWKADTGRTFFFSSQIGRESNVVYQAATARPPRRQLSAGVIRQKIRRAQPTETNWRWAVQHQLQQHDLVVENGCMCAMLKLQVELCICRQPSGSHLVESCTGIKREGGELTPSMTLMSSD